MFEPLIECGRVRRPVLSWLVLAVTITACGTTAARSTESPSSAGVVPTTAPALTRSTATDTGDEVIAGRSRVGEKAKERTSTTRLEPIDTTATIDEQPPTQRGDNGVERSTKRFTAAFVGDILPHSPLWRRARRDADELTIAGPARLDLEHDFRPMFARVADRLRSADLAVCHLETPIAPAGEAFTTAPLYGVPPGIVDAIAWSGFDRCSTASNHTLDRGLAGIDRTVDLLESVGVAQSGMARRPEEIAPRTFVVNDIVVSHLSYTFSYNGLRLPADATWRSALIDSIRIIGDARAARDLGADVVIVSMHWGTEGVSAPNRQQRRVADEITASGAVDLIIGHHAHVLQPIERVNGTWVAFGLSNVLSNLPTRSFPPASADAGILEVTIAQTADGSVQVGRPELVPTWVDRENGWVIREVRADLAAGVGPLGSLQRSLERTLGVVGGYVAVG